MDTKSESDRLSQKKAKNKIAIILNRNAKKVSKYYIQTFEKLASKYDVLLSSSSLETETFIKKLAHQGIHTIIAGGGDGTLMNVFNTIHREYHHFPFRMGILKLGTGNALANLIGARDPEIDLHKMLHNEYENTYRLPLIGDEENTFFFGGIGLDAQILNDYMALKDTYKNTFVSPFIQSVCGYLYTSFFQSLIPKNRFHGSGVIVNEGSGLEIDPITSKTTPLQKGQKIFDGQFHMICFSTIPYYGYNMKVFPYAGIDPSKMHLRILTGPLYKSVLHLHQIWNGSYTSEYIKEFLVDRVTVQCHQNTPYHSNGDGMGNRKEISLSIISNTVPLVSAKPIVH